MTRSYKQKVPKLTKKNFMDIIYRDIFDEVYQDFTGPFIPELFKWEVLKKCLDRGCPSPTNKEVANYLRHTCNMERYACVIWLPKEVHTLLVGVADEQE